MDKRKFPIRYETPVLTRQEQIREIISLVPDVSYELWLILKEWAIDLVQWVILGVILVWVPVFLFVLMAMWIDGMF